MAINLLSYRFIRCVRTVFYAGLLVFVATTAQAATHTINDIEVDITADNAVAAREEAFEAAQIKGYEALAAEFLSEEEMASFKAPDINTVARYVKDFEVTNEKLSATRYKGVYTIRYSTLAFEKPVITEEENNPYSQNASKTLVLPFYKLGNQTYLWQANPFMEAWVSARVDSRLKDVALPVGDINDVRAIQDHQAFSYDPYALDSMRARYNAGSTALLIANPRTYPDGNKEVTIGIYKPTMQGNIRLIKQFTIRGYPAESQDLFYMRAVGETIKALPALKPMLQPEKRHVQQPSNPYTEQPTTRPTGPIETIQAQLNFKSMREWIDMKRKMEQSSAISGVQVKTLSPRFALLSIEYQGNKDGLKTALNQAGVAFIDPMTFFKTNAQPEQQGIDRIYQLRSLSHRQFY